MNEMPEWLRKRPPLTDEDIREGVAAARRFLARATPDMAVEPQRLIVALADRLERSLDGRQEEIWAEAERP